MAKLTFDECTDLVTNADIHIDDCLAFLHENKDKVPPWAAGRFVPSVIRQGATKGGENLSLSQKAWMFKIHAEIETPPPPLDTIILTNLKGLFDGAAEKLKFPKMTFQFTLSEHMRLHNQETFGTDFRGLDTLTPKLAGLLVELFENDFNVRLYRAGKKSKYEGCVQVTSAERYDRNWYGRILKDGTFQIGPQCPDDVKRFLAAFNRNVTKVSKFFGWNSGNCCYCNRLLSDDRSLDAGYGPVCAKHYQQPWGK